MYAPMTEALPALLVHPPLGLFEMQLAGKYEVVHWPTDRADVSAAATIGGIGLSNAMIDALPALKTIACFGVGVDGIDPAYCRARGITITNGPGINSEDVADVAIGLVIALSRGFTQAEKVLRDGEWLGPMPIPPQRRLRGRKLGIVGMGAIGKAVAARAQAFGLAIAWTGPHLKPEIPHHYEPELEALAHWADILVLALRGDKSNEKIVDAKVLAALGGDGVLVNVSRGSVVDEDALIAALKAGELGGAGLDVFAQEPANAERWRGVPNTTLLPHIGGGTREALLGYSQNVMENIRRHFAGEPLLTPVTRGAGA